MITRTQCTVAFATHAGRPAVTDDDELFADALRRRGVNVMQAVWNDPAVEWRAFAAVIIRSCWDYHLHLPAFLDWVDGVASAGVLLLNTPALIHWNSDKVYLRALAERGVPVVPTRWVEQGSSCTLESVLADLDTVHAVVKPAVSASAHDTWRTSRKVTRTDEARFSAVVARGRVLVQPYVDSIATDGEWSLIFIGGEFSHAVLKRPQSGDFRVQAEYGGTAIAASPDSIVIEQARRSLVAGPPDAASSLYARVDGCVIAGEFVLMELELIEPSLFLVSSSSAADRLATTLIDRRHHRLHTGGSAP